MPEKPAGNFSEIFARLKAILLPFAKKMKIVKDDKQWYYLDTNSIGANKKPIGFAAVRIGKNYVSFYLMPIYMNAKLQAAISAELKKRMQGKACFNFAEVDVKLFAELKSLTKASAECFKKLGIE